MASSLDYVEYVCEQMHLAGTITFKKMFGEYALYCDGKCFGLVCDNQLFITPTTRGLAVVPNATMGIAYNGAKPRIRIECIENKALLCTLIQETCIELPMPKPKQKRRRIK